MTLVAVSTGIAILALIGLLLGAVVLGVVLALLQNVLRPIREIDRYASAILAGGVGIARGVDGADELARTRELGLAVPGIATGYLERAGIGGAR